MLAELKDSERERVPVSLLSVTLVVTVRSFSRSKVPR